MSAIFRYIGEFQEKKIMKQNNSDTKEKKLNIVEILKSVEVSTKLWSPVFGIFTMEEKKT